MYTKIPGTPLSQLVVFAVIFPVATYILFKHGRRGILGWLCLQSFCVVRVVGSVLQTTRQWDNPNASTSQTTDSDLATTILSSIGLSPLLLACLGILHEARRARNPKLHNKLEWCLVMHYHLLISIAMALVIIGIIRLNNRTDLSPSDSTFMMIGFAAITAAWIILMAWALLSLRQRFLDTTTYAHGMKLVRGVIQAMPFILARLIYGMCYFFATGTSFRDSTVAKVLLSVLPEMVAVLVLIGPGVATVNMWRVKKEEIYAVVPQAQPYEGGAQVPLLDLETAQLQQKRFNQQQY